MRIPCPENVELRLIPDWLSDGNYRTSGVLNEVQVFQIVVTVSRISNQLNVNAACYKRDQLFVYRQLMLRPWAPLLFSRERERGGRRVVKSGRRGREGED